MACVYCDGDGYWVCESGVEEPDCDFPSLVPKAAIYLGRYRIKKGTWTVWRRGNKVSISECAPKVSNGGSWTAIGCIEFPVNGDYDVWRENPGNRIKIELSEDVDCSECD
jgi:hypothetical protein